MWDMAFQHDTTCFRARDEEAVSDKTAAVPIYSPFDFCIDPSTARLGSTADPPRPRSASGREAARSEHVFVRRSPFDTIIISIIISIISVCFLLIIVIIIAQACWSVAATRSPPTTCAASPARTRPWPQPGGCLLRLRLRRRIATDCQMIVAGCLEVAASHRDRSSGVLTLFSLEMRTFEIMPAGASQKKGGHTRLARSVVAAAHRARARLKCCREAAARFAASQRRQR